MSDSNVITPQGLADLNAELADLEGRGRREIADRIRTAREWGDLKENSEYHDAKNDQAHLETRILRLREKIAAADVTEIPEATGAVGFGSTVVVEDEQGQRQTWQIVSSHEAAPVEGRLSVESPVARALSGRGPGDRVTISLPRGQRDLRIVEVS
ncbi:MAG TPA: transcription elongation factor GreA [Solirubrobacteraceae bacterium]|jgi:transcription elongation factor GreA|nr:transcription elongation factor GreA [Solirubrobacteraceae bacterium]